MIKLYKNGAYLVNNKYILNDENAKNKIKHEYNKEIVGDEINNSISYEILKKHNTSNNMNELKIKFDSMASHDITYVGIIQTARASRLDKFPIPYVLTNCHNSLCAVGGTINEDDHVFGLSAAKKYGGIFVPAHQAVIHQYMREMMAGGGKMILGSDSHTRYGALGTMAIGEGGGELAKQLLNKTYDINMPEIVGIYLTGKPSLGVGPQDIALAIVKAVFDNGFVKNKVMEFVGDGIKNLNVEYRNGIDVMTTETTCLSSIWQTDSAVSDYYCDLGRPNDFKLLTPKEVTFYKSFIVVDLNKIKSMIAMPFHPSNVYGIDELYANLDDIVNLVEENAISLLENSSVKFSLKDKIKNGKLYAQQGVIAGCAGGTFDNIVDAAHILNGKTIGNDEFNLSVYPSSQPTFISLVENGSIGKLMNSGAIVRSAFCGPCFGAGDVPANNQFSIRHTTRNFPSREGSKPADNQLAYVALVDARTVAASAVNGGILTAGTEVNLNYNKPKYYFSDNVYKNRVYDGFGNENKDLELIIGPNIADWPKMPPLNQNLLLKACAVINDSVTTTDELIPSGETSSYRSNPLALAEFTLSRKDPKYVSRAKEINALEKERMNNTFSFANNKQLDEAYSILSTKFDINESNTGIGSFIYAVKPGDGSAREQAASCQKVLGGYANVAKEYATKRYRSNLVNWGMVPFILQEDNPFEVGDYLFIENIRKSVEESQEKIKAIIVSNRTAKEITLELNLSDDERDIILAGCLINYYRTH